MRRELETLAQIDDFLDGKITKEELQKTVENHEDLNLQIEGQEAIRNVMQKEAFMIQSKDAFSKLKLLSAIKTVIFSIILIGTITFSIFLLSNNEKTSELNAPISPKVKMSSPIADQLIHTQFFQINNSKDTVITTQSGMILSIPQHTFETSMDKQCKIEIKEAISPTDIIKGGLNTMAGPTLLETGGMFKISAFQDDKELTLNNGKSIEFMVPTSNKTPGMRLYKGNVQTNGDITWKSPKKLTNPLTPSDINSLNFYPNEFEKFLLKKGLNRKNKKWKDSVYYDVTNLTVEEKTFVGKDTTLVYKFKSCINPNLIKTFWNRKFNNTLLATLEFEKRMPAIHKSGDNRILNLYTNNLEKNLFEIDSMAWKIAPQKHKKSFYYFMQLREQTLSNSKSKRTLALLKKAIKASQKKRNKITSSANISYYRGSLVQGNIFNWMNIDIPLAVRKAIIAAEKSRYIELKENLKETENNTADISGNNLTRQHQSFNMKIENADKFESKKCFAYLLRKDANSFEKIPIKNNQLHIKNRKPNDYRLAIVGFEKDKSWLCIPEKIENQNLELSIETEESFTKKIEKVASSKRFSNKLLKDISKKPKFLERQQEESKRLELARFIYSSTIDTLFNEQDIFAFKQNRFTVQTFDYNPNKKVVKYLPTQKVDSINCVKAFLNSDKYEFNGKTIQNFKIEILSQSGKNMLKSHFGEPNRYSWPKNLLISSELKRGKTLSRGTYIVKLFYYSQLVSVKTFEVL